VGTCAHEARNKEEHMTAKRIAPLVAVALAIAATGLTGCFKPAVTSTPSATVSQSGTVQPSIEPSANPSPVQATGPITTPPAGSTERKELLDAARKKLGVATQFYVLQLYVQGDTALGDLDPVTKAKNGRLFVAWEKVNGTWTAIGASAFGSHAANAATTARALPSFSSELIAKIDWTLKRPSTKSSPSKSTLSAAKAKSTLEADAKDWSKTTMDGQGAPYTVTLIKVAQDSSGTWWGRVITQPTGNFERSQFWAKYSAAGWSGSPQDPDTPAPDTFFPKSVVSKLGF
jgi:hypothetical protein